MTRRNGAARGTTLIEVMVAMSVLLIGLLGMMDLQIIGLTSNQGARAQMVATQLAREVATGLERLPYGDARLAPTAAFGALLQADGTVLAGFTAAADTLPGVRPDSTIENDGTLVYQRRWTVRDEGFAGSGTRSVAVSVIYRERGNARPKEVVVYGGKVNGALLTGNISAYN